MEQDLQTRKHVKLHQYIKYSDHSKTMQARDSNLAIPHVLIVEMEGEP